MSLDKFLKVNPYTYFRRAKFGMDRFVLIQKYKIHYQETGQGTPLILIPGSQSTSRLWNRLIPFLAAEYRILVLDYFEPGAPNKGFENSLRPWSDIIAQMIKQLNLGKTQLIGWSYGGAVAFDLAARFPEMIDKVISIAGYIVNPEESQKASRLLWKKIGNSHSLSHDIEEGFKSIKTPIMYIYSTKSAYKGLSLAKNLEFLQKYLPQAWIVSLEGAIFESVLKNPQELANLILEYLHKQLAPRTI